MELQALWLTLELAGATCAVLAVVGLPLAYWLARTRTRASFLVEAVVALPLVLPPTVLGFYVLQAAAPLGFAFTFAGILIGSVLFNLPFAVRPWAAAFASVDGRLLDAAACLGASRWRTFRSVTIPIVMPAILAGGLLVFIDAIESFGVPFVLAEDEPVLAVEAYKLFVGELGGNPASAGVLGVLLIVCTAAALLVQRHYLGRRRFSTAARRSPPELVVAPWLRLLATTYCWGVVLLALVPFFAVIVISFLEFRATPATSPRWTSSGSFRNVEPLNWSAVCARSGIGAESAERASSAAETASRSVLIVRLLTARGG